MRSAGLRTLALPIAWQQALDELGAPSGDYHILRRAGLPLCGLPSQAEALAKTLALYRPQRLAARLTVRWAAFCAKTWGLGIFLGRAPYRGKSAHPASGPVGLLAGNPCHPGQRILFCRELSGRYEFGKMARDAGRLQHEARILRSSRIPSSTLPAWIGLDTAGPWTVLRTEYVEATRQRASLADMISLLEQWRLPGPFRPLPEFPIGKSLQGAPPELLRAATAIPLQPSVRHGDFASWNLLADRNGGWRAVDWEEASEEDAPGFDLVHALLQGELLVRRSSFSRGLASMRQTLASPAVASYLTAVGWEKKSELLLQLALWREAQSRPEVHAWLKGFIWSSNGN